MKLKQFVGLATFAALASLAAGTHAVAAPDVVTLESIQGKWVQQMKLNIVCDSLVDENHLEICRRTNSAPENYVALTFTIVGDELRYSLTTTNDAGEPLELPMCALILPMSLDDIRDCAPDMLIEPTKIVITTDADGNSQIGPKDDGEASQIMPFARRVRIDEQGQLRLQDLAMLYASDEEVEDARLRQLLGEAKPGVQWEAVPYVKIP